MFGVPFAKRFPERKLPVRFEEKTVVGPTNEIAFKYAWKNSTWHAYEALSLDLADADGIKDKARRWRGHLDAAFEGKRDPSLKISFSASLPQIIN